GSQQAQANWLKTDVGVLTLGPIQLAYSPGEVFPFTEVRGPIEEAQMPFPTNCYEPLTNNFYCGTPLPLTTWTSAGMTQPYRFLVGPGGRLGRGGAAGGRKGSADAAHRSSGERLGDVRRDARPRHGRDAAALLGAHGRRDAEHRRAAAGRHLRRGVRAGPVTAGPRGLS